MCDFNQQELLVLSLIAKGMLTKEIAKELRVSIEQTQKCIRSVYKKLKVKNRVQAVVKAIVFELIDV